MAVIELHAVAGLIKAKELKRIYQLDKTEFSVAMIAVAGVLFFGILKGVMVAVMPYRLSDWIQSAPRNLTWLMLGRIGSTHYYSDIQRHPDNIIFNNILILRIESSILYFNAEHVFEKINSKTAAHYNSIGLVILDLSAAPYVDIAGSKMLLQLREGL